ncbi:MAG: aminotransferase class I/II-fold pyridoxal phosphate-dependent enzyme [Bacillota bacterium]|nr:aminotransferase class I/II-fold pyridoxal phosphate-dependent enzyme [Bacillota bacterium]
MKSYNEYSKEELRLELEELNKKYKEYQNLNLNLNMARGKPNTAQINFSMPMMNVLTNDDNYIASDGQDVRNYGDLPGIPEARKLFADYLGIEPEETLVMGNASLNIMYDCVARAMLKGVLGSEKPWCKYDEIKFICPVPGYDRHFTICEFLGIKMIPVKLTEWGPDMKTIQELVKDETVKGIWCVPKYTNPYGGCYSDEAVKQLASMETAAKDFRIFWDNAYAYHYVYKDVEVLNILDECKKAGFPNRPYIFGSTSKITFPGSGVSFFGASKENIEFSMKQLNAESISWDKINMLRHVKFLKDLDGIKSLLDKHANALRPKFDIVLNMLDTELSGLDAGSWVKPDGGYFVTFIAKNNCAKRIYQLCKECGLTMTEPGATHPYHLDPDDSFLRIAPSYPSEEELKQAMIIFTLSAKISTVERLLNK